MAPRLTSMTTLSRGFFRCAAGRASTVPEASPIDASRSAATASSDASKGANALPNHIAKPKDFSEIPGPKSWPVVGTMLSYLPYLGEFSFDRLQRSARAKLARYGPLVREEMMPGHNVVWVFTPEDVEAVSRADGRYPQRRSHLALAKYRTDRPDVYNTGGLLPTNGPDWLKLRSVFQKGLSSPRNVKSYLPVIDAILEEFIARVDARVDAEVTDFLPDLSRLYLELICLVAFDVRLGALTPADAAPSSRSSRLIDAALDANSCILPTDNGPRLWRYFQTRHYRRLAKALAYIEEVAVDLVNRKKASMATHDADADADAEKPVSLLELYLTSKEIDVKDVIGMGVDMILGGIDTTTYTTSFALYHLARNPAAQNALHDEACRLLPDKDSPVTAAVLAQASYTKAVLKETFRMNPISIGVGRILSQDAVLSGYLVPKDTVIVTQNQVTCRLPEYFERPDDFVPERWVKGHTLNTHPSPYLVLPFGHGPRSCIARRLAEQNMQVFLLKVLRRFEVGWAGGELDVMSLLINKPDQPVLTTFKRRR